MRPVTPLERARVLVAVQSLDAEGRLRGLVNCTGTIGDRAEKALADLVAWETLAELLRLAAPWST